MMHEQQCCSSSESQLTPATQKPLERFVEDFSLHI